MLGRLRMSVDECILEYKKLAPNIFVRRKRQRGFWKIPTAVLGKPWFDGMNLQGAISDLLEKKNLNVKLPFKEADDPRCKV
jgi:hypothetical protein